MKHKQFLRSRFPISLFFVYLVVLLLMSGVHTGILVLMEQVQASSLIQTLLPILYWSLVAVALTLFTRRKIITCYDRPMQQLAQATRQVAQGDFSVYVPPVHTPDKLEYLDQMLLDFNQMVAELGSIETMKTDFISNVSHEIKSPLAVISNCAQMLKAGTLSAEEQADAYDTILTHTRRLAELVMNILKLNKIENQVINRCGNPMTCAGS